MSGCNWRKEKNHPHSIFLRIIVLFFMMIPLETGALHGQLSLKEVLEGTAKKTKRLKLMWQKWERSPMTSLIGVFHARQFRKEILTGLPSTLI